MSNSSSTTRRRRRRFDAEAFRVAREDAGVSIRDLAEMADVPEPTLYKLQQGRRRMPRPSTYRKLLHALGLARGSLLMDDTTDPAEPQGV